MKLNMYLIFAFLFFFVNTLGLPQGLSYTAILSPLLYWYAVRSRRKEILLPFFIALLPFVILQAMSGVDTPSFIVSLVYYTTVYIFAQAAYTFLKNCPDLEGIFRKLLIINFIFCIIAIPLYFTPFYELLWIEQYLTKGVNHFRRFKLFAYEASYYSTLFVPIFFFYFLKIILRQNRANSWLLLTLIILPLLLSFSLGVISAMAVAALLTFGLYPRRLIARKRTLNLLALIVGTAVAGLLVLVIFFPENALFVRLGNILNGEDLSGNGRTKDAFVLADRILSEKSHWWGIGAGQIKVLGNFIIREFYAYPNNFDQFGIPNVVAETWVLFGWAGLIIRFALELFFFFRTRVWTNYYRLAIFLFIFLYQFTGSFVTSLAEYLLWLLAFTNVFPQFDANIKKPRSYEFRPHLRIPLPGHR